MAEAEKRKVRVLLVEDDEVAAIAFQRDAGKVEGRSFDVTVASKLEKAIELLDIEQFDVVFLDLNLPNNDANHTIAHIAMSGSPVPVVILTGAGDAKLEAIAEDLEFKGYIAKDDLSPQVIEDSVSSLIGQS